jgi:hypothetical protein
MKLLTVRCEFDYCVVVEDDANATEQYATALHYARDALRDLDTHHLDIDVMPYAQVQPHFWDDECIPYGGDGNTRTGDYLK